MDWQAFGIVLHRCHYGALLVWSRFRHRKFSFQRDTHCGCSAVAHSAPQSSIVFRARKGKRPEVLVKMN